ncbi:MAG: hypothetical protein H7230_01190 [Candidatus Parcubacteria bacterium]|nr:hypothetical protein [Candidatus Paceibacterota bacterium]
MEIKELNNKPVAPILKEEKQWMIVCQLQKKYPNITVKKQIWDSPSSYMKKFVNKFDNPKVANQLRDIQLYFAGDVQLKSQDLKGLLEVFDRKSNPSENEIIDIVDYIWRNGITNLSFSETREMKRSETFRLLNLSDEELLPMINAERLKEGLGEI